MERTLAGGSECLGLPIRYYLLRERSEDGTALYGVAAEYDGEEESIPDVTSEKAGITALIGILRRCGVTPVTMRDVVEDWLLR